MKFNFVYPEDNGSRFDVSISVWTGKKTVMVDGQIIKKSAKNTYVYT